MLFDGYKFEVVDVDHFKIDQLLVTRIVEPLDNANAVATEE